MRWRDLPGWVRLVVWLEIAAIALWFVITH